MKQKTFNGKKVIVTSIWDEVSVNKCLEYEEGDKIELCVGRNLDENTKSVNVVGHIKKIGKLMGYMGLEDDETGIAVTISVDNLDFVITNRPSSFISINHFSKGAGVNYSDYDVIVVKQGYLFAELREVSELSILALTPGATHQIVENFEYHNIVPPVYPLKYVVKE